MGRQYQGPKRTPGYRVERDAKGRFTDIKSIHRSIRRDAATKAKTKKSKSDPGHGHVADYPKAKKKKSKRKTR